MNGQRAGVGDPIVLRQIHHDAESGERGRGLANGDLLRDREHRRRPGDGAPADRRQPPDR